jgi:predicted class III extradiol MEMO1 family dioxygenase
MARRDAIPRFKTKFLSAVVISSDVCHYPTLVEPTVEKDNDPVAPIAV